MSKTFEFEKTSISSQFAIDLLENHSMDWPDFRTSDLYRVLFTSIASVLKIHQSKEKHRIGFSMKDDKGNFKLGAILNYNKPEEGETEDSGNWYLEFTPYAEDMTDIECEYDNHSKEFISTVTDESFRIASARFNAPEYMYIVLNTAIDTLLCFLDTNAEEEEAVDVVLRGVFTASVAVEDGKKVMSIVPGEAIKQIVKADSIL